jgi:peroxiredoxin/mono/diheme cytochrome c family protein
MRRTWMSLLAGLTCTSLALAQTDGSSDKLGKKIDPALPVAGKATPLADLKGEKATVVFFLSFECPNSTGYTPTVLDLVKDFGEKGVKFVGICENEMTADELKAKVAEFKLPFPVVLDPGQTVADAFKAKTTPEAFLLDHNLVMRYRGRIDNTYNARLKRNAKVTDHDLRNALEDQLAGKPVRTPITHAVGCPIGGRDAVVKAATAVTFHKDVAPILQKNCQNCHRPGEVGPFSLMTYKQAKVWAEDIKEYTANKKMPPWKPTDGVPFHNDRRMSDADIKTLAAWVDGGTPEGDAKDAPPPLKFTDGWMLGKPDLILTTGDEFLLGPSGPDTFRCYVIPTNLPEDKYIIGFEVKPGNPGIVHHTLNYWDITGQGKRLEAKARKDAKPEDADRGPGYSTAMGVGFIPLLSPRAGVPPVGNWGGWAPGQLPRILPEGTGYLLPKGADVIIQVHYHRNGKPEKDQTQVGIYLAKKPVERPYQTIVLGPKSQKELTIAANVQDHRIAGTVYLQADATLHSVMPHMHLIGKSVKVSMTPPGDTKSTLVDIPEWDYNWQETYWLKEPIKLKAGTKLEIEANFDNSSKNPNNPSNPPALVKFGEHTTNEMLFGFMGVTTDDGKRVRIGLTPPK